MDISRKKDQIVCSLPTAEKLREAYTSDSVARDRLKAFFDADTFVELGAYTKRSFHEFVATEKTEQLEGVVCGYGAVCGARVFAFAQDPSRMKGALDARHAKKICDLYALAMKTGAPIVGIFDCAGADIFEGVEALAGYASLMRAVSDASGVIPQIAVIAGLCLGSLATLTSMFDMTVMAKGASLYMTSPTFLSKDAEEWKSLSSVQAEDVSAALAEAARLIAFLPSNASEALYPEESADSLNRMLAALDPDTDARGVLASVADHGIYHELNAEIAPEMITAFAVIGGVKCGVCASDYTVNEGKLTSAGARKAARFITLCDAFGLSVVTLANSAGIACEESVSNLSFASDLAKLASAYASASVPKVTVILGHAIGASYILLGAKSLGADIAYALDEAEIGALTAEDAVAFAWSDRITLTVSRDSLESEWKNTVASPIAAASTGEIDDIISITELRQRICTSLLLLSSKGSADAYRHAIDPL